MINSVNCEICLVRFFVSHCSYEITIYAEGPQGIGATSQPFLFITTRDGKTCKVILVSYARLTALCQDNVLYLDVCDKYRNAEITTVLVS